MSDNFSQVIHSRFWHEEAEADNPYAAARVRCGGYDVYGDLLGKAGYIDYLYLLLRGERASLAHSQALELLAVMLANPGPRDPAVHAAAAAGATGNPASSALMAAIAAGAGGAGGAREVLLAMQLWQQCGTSLPAWQAALAQPVPENRPLFWAKADCAAGFDPHAASSALPVRQSLGALCRVLPDGALAWLTIQRPLLEAAAGQGLTMLGVAAAALFELGFSPAQGEMLALLLRLPGAAAHALEQGELGFRQFPFFELAVDNDPGPAAPELKEAA